MRNRWERKNNMSHIEYSRESFLNLMGYPHRQNEMSKLMDIIEDKYPFLEDKLGKLMTLKDHLEVVQGYLSISNSNNRIKIKQEVNSNEEELEFIEIIKKWSEKTGIVLDYDPEKDIYYINEQ